MASAAETTDRVPLLGAYAAKQCPYRIFREYDPTEPAVAAEPDESLQLLFDDGIAFETDLVEQILELFGDSAVAIPARGEIDHAERRALTDEALAAGTPIILGALMQPDLEGRRMAEIDLLVATGNTTAAGKAEYLPIDIKSHKSSSRLDDPDAIAEPAGLVHDLHGLLGDRAAHAVAGQTPKYKDREGDCLQLAHYHRLLQAHGHAEPDGDEVWGAILGRDGWVAWLDLKLPAHITLTPKTSPPDPGESEETITFHHRRLTKKRSSLDRYDFEFGFRLRVVDTARQRTSRDDEQMLLPVSVKECAKCPWREPCHSDMTAVDDVSLVTSVDYGAWSVHRFLGHHTVDQLARLDLDTTVAIDAVTAKQLDAALEWAASAAPDASVDEAGWPKLAAAGFATAQRVADLDPATLAYVDTPLTAKSLGKQIREARACAAGHPLVGPSWDPADMPRGDIEIDLDLENESHVYLWGARLTVVPDHWPEVQGTFHPFASFDPLDPDDPDGERREAELLGQLWAWLSDIRARAAAEGLVVRIFGYAANGVEGAALIRISASEASDGLPTPDEVAALLASPEWVDLWPIMKAKFWSNDGHGLKVMAVASGFEWRDDDPGGFASMGWYRTAVDSADPAERQANVERILEYNEDDCIATAVLRDPVPTGV